LAGEALQPGTAPGHDQQGARLSTHRFYISIDEDFRS
jgi:hypothetical protein